MNSEYLLLIRNTAWQKDFSAAQIEKVLNEFSAWVERLKKEGKIKVAVPLEHRGKLFESQNVMVDGPFIEDKDADECLLIFEAECIEVAIVLSNSSHSYQYHQTLDPMNTTTRY